MLFDAGCTEQDCPDGVKWDSVHYEFTYTVPFLSYTAWESPCGLFCRGHFSSGYMSYMGIDWREENNNMTRRCPHDKAGCQLNHEHLRGRHCGIVECAFKLSNKAYDYEHSVEKLNDDASREVHRLKIEFYQKHGWSEGDYCSCVKWDGNAWNIKYDPITCSHECHNDACLLTKRDLSKKGNVYYDLKFTTYRHDHSLWDGEKIVAITKGKKMFNSPIPLAICDEFVKRCKDEILWKEKSNRGLILHQNPGAEIEIENVRAERRETRDLLQDLRDVQEGFSVVHASDVLKQAKEAKKQRRTSRQEKRIEKLLKRSHSGDEIALNILARKGIDYESYPAQGAKPVKTIEQVTLFDKEAL